MAFTPVQKLSITSGAALVLLSLVGIVAYVSSTQLVGAERAVAATNVNVSRVDRVLARTLDAENAQRWFLSTGDRQLLPAIDSAKSDVEYALDSLRQATEDNPEQRRNLDSLEPIISARFADIARSVAVRQKAGRDSADKLMRAERAMRSREGAAPLIQKMRDEEMRILGERTLRMARHGRVSRGLMAGGSVLALLFALIALQPLRPAVAERLAARLSRSVSAVDDTGDPPVPGPTK